MGANPIKFRLKIFLGIFITVLFVGVIGFMFAEDLSFVDAIYFSIVTISTVGYGDVHPVTSLGKIIAMFIIFMGVGTFLGAIGNATELMLSKRETAARMEKLNMVIGVFFSEVGSQLLSVLAAADDNMGNIREELLFGKNCPDEDFLKLSDHLRRYNSDIKLEKIDLKELSDMLVTRRDFLLRLLENPNLLENEAFTGIIWAVYHLAEELGFREDLTRLPETDYKHLLGDVKRVYALLIFQWVKYMQHLKDKYPYLFSLSVRMNPFDKNASIHVME